MPRLRQHLHHTEFDADSRQKLDYKGTDLDIWFSCSGIEQGSLTVMRWYYPVGLLFDIYAETRIWQVNVHFDGWSDTVDASLLDESQNMAHMQV